MCFGGLRVVVLLPMNVSLLLGLFLSHLFSLSLSHILMRILVLFFLLYIWYWFFLCGSLPVPGSPAHGVCIRVYLYYISSSMNEIDSSERNPEWGWETNMRRIYKYVRNNCLSSYIKQWKKNTTNKQTHTQRARGRESKIVGCSRKRTSGWQETNT